MKWRFLNVAVFVANLGLLAGAFYLYFIEATPSSEEITRYEFIDLSLAILNLMVAMLAILLALAGFWGYSAIREAATHKAAEVADRVAREVAQEYAESDGEAGEVRQYADYLRWRKEQTENKAKRPRGPKAPARPTGGEREGDGI